MWVLGLVWYSKGNICPYGKYERTYLLTTYFMEQSFSWEAKTS